MNNGNQISYVLSAAVVLSLCASISAEEVATHSLDAAEKVLLMETINVTSDKEIAEDDLTSGDPEVDEILNLVDSLTTMSDNLNEESSDAESNASSMSDTVDSTSKQAVSDVSEKGSNTDKTGSLDSIQSKTSDSESIQTSD